MTRRRFSGVYAKCIVCGALVDLPPHPPSDYTYTCSRECGMYQIDRCVDKADKEAVRWPSEQLMVVKEPPTAIDNTQVVAAVIISAAFLFATLYFIGIVRGLW